jgi:hypothetical protein
MSHDDFHATAPIECEVVCLSQGLLVILDRYDNRTVYSLVRRVSRGR